MGLSETGGGGSVYWKVDANQVNDDQAHHAKQPGPRKACHQDGRDQDGALGTDFTVSVKVPDGSLSAQNFLDKLTANMQVEAGGKRVRFTLPLEDYPDQIKIFWGSSPKP